MVYVGTLIVSPVRLTASLCLLALAACATRNEELLASERRSHRSAGAPYSRPFERRDLPEVAADSPYSVLEERAVVAHPETEAAYFAWGAALERSIVVGALPQPRVGLGWMITEPVTWTFSNVLAMVSQTVPAPSWRTAAELEALEEARVAHARYDTARLARRARFRQAYAAYDLSCREVELAESYKSLLGERNAWIASRAAFRLAIQEAIRLQEEILSTEVRIVDTRQARASAAARVNAELSREVLAPLAVALPLHPWPISGDDHAALSGSLATSPQRREAEAEIRARARGLERARVENEPEIGLEGRRQETDTMLMVSLSLPLRRERIRAAIAEAEARVKVSEAERRAVMNQLGDELGRALADMRGAVRRADLLHSGVRPAIEQRLSVVAQRASVEAAAIDELYEGRQALIDVAIAIERARVAREIAASKIVEIAGIVPDEVKP